MTLSTFAATGGIAGAAATDVRSAIQNASEKTGVSFSYLMAKAAAESSFDPAVEATTSSATGLYQFIESTWFDMVEKHGAAHGLGDAAKALRDGTADAAQRDEILALRKDPEIAAALAAEFAADNRQSLEQALGRPVDDTELYLAHFLGAGGATSFIKAMENDPEAAAADLFPAAANANQSVFFEDGRARSFDQIFARFETKMQPWLPNETLPERPFVPAPDLPPQPTGSLYAQAPTVPSASYGRVAWGESSWFVQLFTTHLNPADAVIPT